MQQWEKLIQEIIKNVSIYSHPLSALKNDSEKEIFVIGGLELFEIYYTRVTDLFFIKEETLYNGIWILPGYYYQWFRTKRKYSWEELGKPRYWFNSNSLEKN